MSASFVALASVWNDALKECMLIRSLIPCAFALIMTLSRRLSTVSSKLPIEFGSREGKDVMVVPYVYEKEFTRER